MAARERGFSYIELLVTTCLVGIAYVMLLGPSSAWGQNRSKVQCVQQLQQLHAALMLYAAEHDDALPMVRGAQTSEPPLSELVPLYTTDTSLFICPGSGHRALPGAEPFANRRCSYAYVMGLKRGAGADVLLISDAQVHTGVKAADSAVFSVDGGTPGRNHRRYGGNLLFADGHVETIGATAPRALSWPASAVFLNPKP